MKTRNVLPESGRLKMQIAAAGRRASGRCISFIRCGGRTDRVYRFQSPLERVILRETIRNTPDDIGDLLAASSETSLRRRY